VKVSDTWNNNPADVLAYVHYSICCVLLDSAVVKTSRCVVGDNNAHKVLECIGFIPALYGENIILIQYLPSITDLVSRLHISLELEVFRHTTEYSSQNT